MFDKFAKKLFKKLISDEAIPNYYRINQILTIQEVFERCYTVPGACIECGVGTGGTLSLILNLVNKLAPDKLVFGYDSFNGFPNLTNIDTSFRNAKPGRGELYARNWQNSIYELDTLLKSKYFDLKQLTLVQGFFSEVLTPEYVKNTHGTDGISFIHLDVDLYDSYVVCLRELYPYLNKGGVILFDEYLNAKDKWPGAIVAIDEFLAKEGEEIRHSRFADRYYLIKGKERVS